MRFSRSAWARAVSSTVAPRPTLMKYAEGFMVSSSRAPIMACVSGVRGAHDDDVRLGQQRGQLPGREPLVGQRAFRIACAGQVIAGIGADRWVALGRDQ